MWNCIRCSKNDLQLKLVLTGGQSFRWKLKPGIPEVWVGIIFNKLWHLKQLEDGIYYQSFENTNKSKKKKKLIYEDEKSDSDKLYDYFQLGIDIPKLYKQWCSADVNLKQLHDGNFSGIRVLRQDPVENLFSFICSQNNNVSRISQLVEKLCSNFGEKIKCNDEEYYTFPTVESLASKSSNTEDKLRSLGFGYRAKFIYKAAEDIMEEHGGAQWLYNLKKKTYQEAHDSLCSLMGVGAKVADCVCLMSLDKTNAIPVDTHMYQVACKHYLKHIDINKSVTPKVYKEISNYFRDLYGDYSGWAQSVLFTAALNSKKETVLNKVEYFSDKSNQSATSKRKLKVNDKEISKKKK